MALAVVPVKAPHEAATGTAENDRLDALCWLLIEDDELGHRLRNGQTGIEAIHLLREIAGREIDARLISGGTDAKLRQLAQDEGLVLLQKPVKPAKLRSLL